MQQDNGPSSFSFCFGAALGVVVLLLHQAPRSVVTVYVANSGHTSHTQLAAGSLLMPLLTSLCTLAFIAYLFWLAFALHGARRRTPVSASAHWEALLSSNSVLQPADLAPIPLAPQRDF